MTQRQEQLLENIIGEYVHTAEPISSKFLEKTGIFELSSATIRNEMNDLENMGYLTQFHTSGGRVPTDKAYRFFVDNLLNQNRIEPEKSAKKKIQSCLQEVGNDPREINRMIAKTLSELSDNLVITNILEDDDFYKIGLSSLFEMPEFHEFEKIFRLTSFFDEFEEIFGRIGKGFFGDPNDPAPGDLKIFIGRENRMKNIKDETVIFAQYQLPHRYTGSLTLVGPTRMDYEKNIGLVKYTTGQINKLI